MYSISAAYSRSSVKNEPGRAKPGLQAARSEARCSCRGSAAARRAAPTEEGDAFVLMGFRIARPRVAQTSHHKLETLNGCHRQNVPKDRGRRATGQGSRGDGRTYRPNDTQGSGNGRWN